MRPLLFAALAGGAAIVVVGFSARYRRDLNAARARLAKVDRRVFPTAWGARLRQAVACGPRHLRGLRRRASFRPSYDLESIRVPTLLVHTKDDPLASHDASRRAAERIPGARFLSLESGGHLYLGQMKIIRDELADFFADRIAEQLHETSLGGSR